MGGGPFGDGGGGAQPLDAPASTGQSIGALEAELQAQQAAIVGQLLALSPVEVASLPLEQQQKIPT